MATREALVPFFDHGRVSVAYGLRGGDVVLLNLRRIESLSNEIMA